MSTIKKYILISTIFALFSEFFYFKLIIDWKLFYLILLFNYILIIIVRKKLTLPNILIIIIIFFLIHGILGALYFKFWPKYLLSQIIGISFSCIYFYNYFRVFSLKQIMKMYVILSNIILVIGFFIYSYNVFLLSNSDYRFHSIMLEPAHYIPLVIPVFCYYLYYKGYFWLFFYLLAIVLSGSSVAYLGIILLILLKQFNFKFLIKALYIVPFILGIIYFTYTNNENVKLRIDDTIKTFDVFSKDRIVEKTNFSTYAILSNAYVAEKNFESNLLGSGLGSHGIRYEELIKKLKVPKSVSSAKADRLNQFDANSLFIRIVSDFGIIGIIIVFYTMIKSFRIFKIKSFLAFFSQGIYIYFCLKLLREGHYFSPEFYFFIWFFYYVITYYQNSDTHY